MDADNSTRNTLLAKLGLQEYMVEKNPGPAIFDWNIYDCYVSEEYKNSSRKKTDGVYRMSEIVFMHKASGMRIEYLETEDYFGEETEFKIIDAFIITLEHKKLKITDIDFSKQHFVTPDGLIPFSAVKKSSFGD